MIVGFAECSQERRGNRRPDASKLGLENLDFVADHANPFNVAEGFLDQLFLVIGSDRASEDEVSILQFIAEIVLRQMRNLTPGSFDHFLGTVRSVEVKLLIC